jgi:hypothetical protein
MGVLLRQRQLTHRRTINACLDSLREPPGCKSQSDVALEHKWYRGPCFGHHEWKNITDASNLLLIVLVWLNAVKPDPEKDRCINWRSAWWTKHVLLPIVAKLNPCGILPFVPIELLLQMPVVEFLPGEGASWATARAACEMCRFVTRSWSKYSWGRPTAERQFGPSSSASSTTTVMLSNYLVLAIAWSASAIVWTGAWSILRTKAWQRRERHCGRRWAGVPGSIFVIIRL